MLTFVILCRFAYVERVALNRCPFVVAPPLAHFRALLLMTGCGLEARLRRHSRAVWPFSRFIVLYAMLGGPRPSMAISMIIVVVVGGHFRLRRRGASCMS